MIVYVYGLKDSNDNVVYVGKSSTPKSRLISHKNGYGYTKCIILDTFEDTEFKWIREMNKIYPLQHNKRLFHQTETWEIGDEISLSTKGYSGNRIMIKNLEENILYDSVAHMAKIMNITLYYTRQLISQNPDKYKYV